MSAEETREFNEQVHAEAYRMAREKAGDFPKESDVRTLIPLVRVRMMARRKKGLLDRVAGAIHQRLSSVLAEKAAADREVEKLFAVQRQHEELLNSRAAVEERLKRADQVAAIVRDSAVQLRKRVRGWYDGTTTGSCHDSDHIVAAYRDIAAAERAHSEFPTIRKEIEAEIAHIDAEIAALEKKHADILNP